MPGYRIVGRAGKFTKYVRDISPDPAAQADPVAAVRAIQESATKLTDRKEAQDLLADAALAGLAGLRTAHPERLAAVLRPFIAAAPEVADLWANIRELAAAVAALERRSVP